MKKLILIIFTLNLSSICLSQVTPPQIQYNIEPVWTYISKDTNVVIDPLDAASSIYGRRYPVHVLCENNSIYLSENTSGPRTWGGYDGFLIHSIDIETGDANWIHHNNHYSGQQKVETLLGGLLESNDNGDIVLFNGINKDSSQYVTPYLAFQGHYVSRVFSAETGDIKDFSVAMDDDRENYNVFGIGQIKSIRNKSQEYVHTYSLSIDDGNNNKIERIHLYNIQSNLSIDSSSFQSLDYTYGDPYSFTNNPGHFSFPHFYNQLNDSTLIVLTGDFDNENFYQSPTESHIIWYDISNINEIKEIRKVDATDDFPRPNDFTGTPYLQLTENSVVLSQKINPIVGIDPDGKQFTWLSWYDKDGNLLAKVDCLQGENKNYSFAKVIMEKDDNLIICMSFAESELGRMGHDFIAIPKNTLNTYQFLGSFDIPYTDEYAISPILISKVINPEELFIGKSITLSTNDGDSNIFHYYKLNMSELGIVSSTNDYNIQDAINVSISPNPTRGIFTIETNIDDKINLSVFNTSGKRIINRALNTRTELIDISYLADGVYFILFHDQKTGITKTERLIIER